MRWRNVSNKVKKKGPLTRALYRWEKNLPKKPKNYLTDKKLLKLYEFHMRDVVCKECSLCASGTHDWNYIPHKKACSLHPSPLKLFTVTTKGKRTFDIFAEDDSQVRQIALWARRVKDIDNIAKVETNPTKQKSASIKELEKPGEAYTMVDWASYYVGNYKYSYDWQTTQSKRLKEELDRAKS